MTLLTITQNPLAIKAQAGYSSRIWTPLCVYLLVMTCSFCHAFLSPTKKSAPRRNSHVTKHHSLLFQAKSSSNDVNPASFELGELKLNLKSMAAQKMTTANQIEEAKRIEIEGYVRAVANRRSSSIPLGQLDKILPGTLWRLNFSTQGVTNQALPAGATVQLKFIDDQKLNYSLQFTKTFGLDKLTAVSTYAVETTSSTNPGWVSYEYQDIQTNFLGFKGIGVPLVGGLLQGRRTVIQTVYFDGEVWIERGRDDGGEYFQVYLREEDEMEEGDEPWQG